MLQVWVLESLGPAIDAEGNDLSLEQSLQTMCRKALQQFGVCCISLFEKVIALKRSETPTEPVWQNDIRDDDIKAALGAVEAREIRVATEDGQPQTAYVFNTSRGRPDTNLQKYAECLAITTALSSKTESFLISGTETPFWIYSSSDLV